MPGHLRCQSLPNQASHSSSPAPHHHPIVPSCLVDSDSPSSFFKPPGPDLNSPAAQGFTGRSSFPLLRAAAPKERFQLHVRLFKKLCVVCAPHCTGGDLGTFFQSLFCPSSLEGSKLWGSNSGHEHFHGETLEPSRCPISSVFW